MRKGVVIKLNQERAILMAEDCRFCEVKAFRGMYEGMEVCFKDTDILKRKVIFRENKYVNAACFMLLIFCSYLFLSFYQENIAAYAYVGIDMNPSVEIALNKKGQIIKARGLDQEGREILEEIDIRKMDSVEGVKKIIAKTIDMDFLGKEDVNEITVYAVMEREDNKGGNELIQKMEQAIKQQVVAYSIKGEIKTIVSDKKVKDKADKAGLSVAEYISEDAKAVLTDNKNNKDIKKEKGKEENKGKQEKEEKNDSKEAKYSNDNKDDKKNKNEDKKKEVNGNNIDKKDGDKKGKVKDVNKDNSLNKNINEKDKNKSKGNGKNKS